ncbi:MAG: hypothetical protein IPO74_11535 [Thermomonas sp.]|nr:hypothetical protein [Thermomonas sp.]
MNAPARFIVVSATAIALLPLAAQATDSAYRKKLERRRPNQGCDINKTQNARPSGTAPPAPVRPRPPSGLPGPPA